MRRRRDEELYGAFDEQEDELSLEAILAEYGKGGRQPVPTEEAAIPETPAEEKAPVPVSEAVPPSETEAPSEPAAPEKNEPEYESPAPDRVALKDIMSQTVDAVLEDEDDGVIAQPVPLRERLAAVLERFHRPAAEQRRRPAFQDTEQLFDEPEEEPEPEEPPEPEPTMDDAAREAKWQCARTHRQRMLLALPALLTVIVAVIDGLDVLSQGWYDHVWLRCGIPAGLLILCLLLCPHLWQEAWEHLRHGRVTAPAAALLCGLVALADSAWCLFLGNCPNLPFAAPAAALLYLCVCGQYRAARARYDSFRLAQLGGVPPYVASVTAAGACKQQGRLEGFYRLWQSPDPAARWQPILTPLYLALATVLALVAALAGHQMNRFLWLWSALLSATVPLSLPLSGTLPLSLLCRRLHKSGCAVAGWKGARAISAARRVVVTDEDLFPAGVLSLQKKGKEGPASAPVGTVELNGLKVYGEEINQALAYAEALCRAAGSQLTPLFQQLMDGQVSFRYDAHDLHYYEDGGVDCTIRGATVAMGSAYFMKKRRITLPHDLKMDTGVFMSVDGRLAAIFVVKYLPSRNVEWALRALRRNRVTPVLATRGVNITPNMLKRKFRLNARPIYPGVATRLALADLTGQRGEAPNAIIYRDGLLPMAETVIGSQRMCQAVRWSTILSWIGGLCGLVLSYYLTTAGDFAALSPLYMLAFLVLLLLPTLLLSGLVKYY